MNIEPTGTPPTATGAIRQAARMTGADFKYLLATAQVESNLNPNAQAPASSARGLFQFIEQTWLATLKEQGPALGYAPYANAISRDASGQYAVTDPGMYDRIMNLRSDPAANALMAGAYTRANNSKLAERLGRAPSEGELYIAHFLGANGAMRLIEVAQSRPHTPAAALFPGPAKANPTIFYDASGSARSVGEVYRNLVGRYGVARSAPASAASANAQQAAAPALRPAMRPTVLPELPARAAATVQPTQPAVTAATIQPAQPTLAVATAEPVQPVRPPKATGDSPMFYGLFRSAGENEPVAPVVNALWGTPAAALPQVSEPAPPATASAAPRRPQSLDLFQDQVPDARALFRGRV